MRPAWREAGHNKRVIRWRRRAIRRSSGSVWALPTSAGATVRVSGVIRRLRDGSAPRVTVDAVSFDVSAGQSVALLGPSGSGKTTLVHLIAGLDRPDAGVIMVDGVAVHELTPDAAAQYRRRIGLVTRRQVPLAGLRVIENVIAPAAPYRVEFDRMARARQLLDMMGLGDHAWARMEELSTGQVRQLFLARALINYPRLLVVEGITTGLDSATGAAVLDRLFDVQSAMGLTLITATEDVRAASRCERIISLRDGAVVDDEIIAPAPVNGDESVDEDQAGGWPDPGPWRRPRLIR